MKTQGKITGIIMLAIFLIYFGALRLGRRWEAPDPEG